MMRWTPPADGIEVPAWKWFVTTTKAGDVRDADYNCRPRYRKERVPGARRRRARARDGQAQADPREGARVLRDLAGMPGRPRCLRCGPLLGSRADQAGARGAADAAAVREALR